MSTAAQPKVVNFADMLGDMAGLTDTPSVVDIITFVEAPWGFGMGSVDGVPALLPAQKFILKAFYGIPLDDTEKTVPIYDQFKETLLYTFTEKEFLDYLYDQGRINTKDLRGQQTTLVLVCGRRGTKTTVTSMIGGYEIYRMLQHYHPQKYYGVMPDDIISMTCLSTSEENAKILYDRAAGNLERSPFFKDFMDKSPNKTELTLRSSRDQEEFGKKSKKFSVQFTADACSARGLRGPNNIFVALDEVAHFFKEGSGKATSDKSDKAVYEAVTPSLAMFKHPDESPAGRIILISSPADKSGLLWDEYQRSFDPELGSDVLMIQLPSWEMNPKIPSSFLRSQYNKNAVVFDTEYGSNFSDRLSGWLDDPSILRRCVDESWQMRDSSSERMPFFLGGDVGLKGDATSLAVVHVEETDMEEGGLPIIVLDWIGERFANKEKPKVDGIEPTFTVEEVVDWVEEVCNKFNIHKGLLDQYYKMSVEPLLKNRNLTQIECRHFNDSLNSDVYHNLMSRLVSKGLRLPGTGKVDAKGNPVDSPLVEEMLQLQVIHKSKYMIKVFVPEGNGRHDDKSDALARAVKLACEYIEAGGIGAKKKAGGHSVGRSIARAQARMAAMDTKRPHGSSMYRTGSLRFRGRGPF